MKKVIHGKRYNTETAKRLGSMEYGIPGDFDHVSEDLYRKKTGEFFLYGEGGPKSKYSVSTGMNSYSGSEAITPITVDQAMEWVEKYLSADDYEEIFGEVSEDESTYITTFSLSPEGKEALETLAKKYPDLSKSKIVDNILIEAIKK